ncbi:MAG TPA: hypothetical protein VKP69_19470, partial [Isosphaeraceae bacterium]|nr:hypothetical protein [Isosphaeraceae bacterium]
KSAKRRGGPSQCGEENFWQVLLRRIAASLPLPIEGRLGLNLQRERQGDGRANTTRTLHEARAA